MRSHQLVAGGGQSAGTLGGHQVALGGQYGGHTASAPFAGIGSALLPGQQGLAGALHIVGADGLIVDPVQFGPGQQSQKLPAQVQRLVHRPVLVLVLTDKVLLKRPAEGQVLLVGVGEFVLADDAGQASGVLHLGVGGEELVGQGRDGRPG